MLAPVAESDFGEGALTALGIRAAEGFEAFCAELAEASGEDPGFRATGTLIVARDADDAAVLERLLAFRRVGRPAGGATAAEPGAPRRAGARADRAPRARRARRPLGRPAQARGRADDRRGARRRRSSASGARRRGDRRAIGSRACGSASGEVVEAPRVVLAGGAWSGQVDVPDPVPVRPVKGQIMRLHDPRGPGLVDRTIRTPQGGYMVSRGDGALRARRDRRGARLRHRADRRRRVRARARPLRGDPRRARARARRARRRPAPGSPDNVPSIGPGALEGLVWATGHYRNGILLAHLTPSSSPAR